MPSIARYFQAKRTAVLSTSSIRLVVVMVASAHGVGRALSVLEETVPWSNKTLIPSVSTTVGFAIRESGRLSIIAIDEANERHHEFTITNVDDPDRCARAAIRAIHAPFN